MTSCCIVAYHTIGPRLADLGLLFGRAQGRPRCRGPRLARRSGAQAGAAVRLRQRHSLVPKHRRALGHRRLGHLREHARPRGARAAQPVRVLRGHRHRLLVLRADLRVHHRPLALPPPPSRPPHCRDLDGDQARRAMDPRQAAARRFVVWLVGRLLHLRRVVWRGRPRLGRRAGGNFAARRQGARVSALQAAARRRLGRVLLVVLDEGVPPCRRVAGPHTHTRLHERTPSLTAPLGTRTRRQPRRRVHAFPSFR
mmetsp:Transcript_30886/g.97401  ORF Transcript_30886/g.97401 Transcript_30886/m.97401 type:complete len:254 (-) Transcript_30886:646-1407(-)